MDNNNKIIEKLLNTFKEAFSTNLQAIIVSGSFFGQIEKTQWSDLDLLIILEKLEYSDCLQSARLAQELEKTFNTNVSVDTVSLKDVEKVNREGTLYLHTKTIQSLFEAKLYPHKVIFKNKALTLPIPNKEIIRKLSDELVTFFYNDLRKTIIRNPANDLGKSKAALKITIKRLFNMMKMSYQYLTYIPTQSKNETLNAVSKLNLSFELKIAYKLLKVIKRWEQLNDQYGVNKYLEQIFNFSSYYYRTFEEHKNVLIKNFK